MVAAAVFSGAGYWYWSRPETPTGGRRVAQVAVSGSGQWFAAGSVAGQYALWNREHPEHAQHFRIAGGAPRALAFHPEEERLAIAHSSGLVLHPVQQLGSDEPLRAGTGFQSVAFQPHSGALLAVTEERVVEWLGKTCCGEAPAAVFSPDGRRIATSGPWPALWDTKTGAYLRSLEADGEFGPVAFDARRGWVVMGARDGRVYAWDVEAGELRAKSPEPAGSVDSVAVLKNSPWIVFAKTSTPMHMWNPDTGEMRTLEALPYSNVVAGPERASVLFGNYAGSVELWNVETGKVLSRFTLR